MDAEINAMLDSPAWNPRHVPNSLTWIHSESVTLIGDLVVSIIMEILDISPQKILAHIRIIYDTEIEDLPTLSRAVNAPLYGYLVGDEPPPPPRTKVEYYFQLNSKHCLSLKRAEYLFNSLSSKQQLFFDDYMKNICNMTIDEIMETKWNFLYHVMKILT